MGQSEKLGVKLLKKDNKKEGQKDEKRRKKDEKVRKMTFSTKISKSVEKNIAKG